MSDLDNAYDLLNGVIDADDWLKVRKQLDGERQRQAEEQARARKAKLDHRANVLFGLALTLIVLALIGGIIGGIVYNAHDERNERIARLDACARGSDPVDICLMRLTGDPDR